MKQRVISGFLVIVMLVSMFPTSAFAANDGNTTEVDTGDVSIRGTNGFGALLSAELTDNQTEGTQEQPEYEAGYTVTGLEINGNQATVKYNSMEAAVLLVAIYTEDWMQLLASGQVLVSPEADQAIVTIEGEMPEYFQASAYLMDTYDMSPLCVAYTTPLYTREMQELLASTIHDYDEDRVLNLDEDETTNFAVYAEDTIVIEEQNGVNTIVFADNETATYVIENVDEGITGLQVGDIFVYPYSEENILIIKVASISIDGTTVTITGDETLEMEEVFQAAKIEGTSDTSDIVVDDSTADEGITYLGEEVEMGGEVMPASVDGGGSATVSKKFKIEKKGDKSTSGGGVSGSYDVCGSFSLQLQIRLKYYLSLNNRYLEFKITSRFDFSFDVSTQFTLADKLGFWGVSPVPGVYVGLEPKLMARFSGKLSVGLGMYMVLGFKYDKNGVKNLSSSPKLDPQFDVHGTFFLGIDFCPKVKILDDGFATISLNMLLGGEITVTEADYMWADDAPSRHQCRRCITIDLAVVGQLGGTMKFLDKKWLTVSINLANLKIPLASRYYSYDTGRFGIGECPNVTHRVTVELLDMERNPVPNWNLTVSALDEPVTTNENGVAVFYTRAGSVEIRAEREGNTACAQRDIQTARKIKLILNNTESVEDEEGNPGGVVGDIESGNFMDSGLVNSGNWDESEGDDVHWELYGNGVLRIYGSGAMKGSYNGNKPPWFKYRLLITTLIVEDGVTAIGANTFSMYNGEAYDNLTSITLADTVTYIGSHAFDYCRNLASINTGNRINTIGHSGSVTTICAGAFDSCRSLTSITIINSEIGGSAFSSCDGLTSVTIGDGVPIIGSHAFYGCRNLSTVTMSDDVWRIEGYAFRYSDGLDDVYYAGTQEQWNSISMGDYNYPLWYATIHYGVTIPTCAAQETIDIMRTPEMIVSDDPYAVADDAQLLISDVSGEGVQPSAVYPGDYNTEATENYILKTASFTGLVPAQQYVLLALKSLEVDNILSADNLLYIHQAEALEDGTLTFQYVQRESADVSYVMACGASNKNLSDAQITFPEMTAGDTLQTINPTVVYDGETLTEGKDYVIVGVVDYTEAGEYVCFIRGIYSYTGLVECRYTVESDIIFGDVNADRQVNTRDVIILLDAIAGKTTGDFTEDQRIATDVNCDGRINIRDALIILFAIVGKETDQL